MNQALMQTSPPAGADTDMKYNERETEKQDEAGLGSELLVSPPDRPPEEQEYPNIEVNDQPTDDENPELREVSQLQNRKKRRVRSEPPAPGNGHDENQ